MSTCPVAPDAPSPQPLSDALDQIAEDLAFGVIDAPDAAFAELLPKKRYSPMIGKWHVAVKQGWILFGLSTEQPSKVL